MGTLNHLNEHGDTEVVWDLAKPETVAVARAEFEALLKGGNMAYTVAPGQPAEVIHTFDPQAERIVVHGPLVGG